MIRVVMIAAVLCLPAIAQAGAQEQHVGPIVVSQPWARATPPMAGVAGGYVSITNIGDEPDRLLGGSAPSARVLEVHESSVDANGVARMRPLEEGLLVPPGETVVLEPGGVHIMIMGPEEPLKVGQRYDAVLRFERAGEVSVAFDVVPMGGQPDNAKLDHEP